MGCQLRKLSGLLQWGRYLWMHNGVVGGFMAIRRAMLAALGDGAYDTVQSFHSDSAVAFALFLNHLPDLNSQLQPSQLLKAMEVRTSEGCSSSASPQAAIDTGFSGTACCTHRA